ncbi:MAG: M28 family peptidase [Actinomycetota bacterium]|nr:M28 family peptidase [Actinomycetota bacterium]
MSYRKKTLEQEQLRRRHTKRLSLAAALLLVAGMATGVGLNVLFGKNPVIKEKKVKETSKNEKTGEKPKESVPESKGNEITFSVSQAMAHVFVLSEQIGARPAGSIHEVRTGDYIVQKLGEYGYTVEEQPFTMIEGLASRNIIASRKGSREGFVVVVGAHYDSGKDSKGAIDNASGVATVLELARVFSRKSLEPTVRFVFFGANKPGSGSKGERFQGSSQYVEALGTMDKKEIVGMIAVDSVASGEFLTLRTQESGPTRLKAKLETFSRKNDIQTSFLKALTDSDNVPFEDERIPSLWIEWCDSEGNISVEDTYKNVIAGKIEEAGKLLEEFLMSLKSDDLDELKY